MTREELLRAADNADEVSAGLQLFLDNIPQRRTDIVDCIRELLALGSAIREIADEHPNYEMVTPKLTSDVHMCIRSLELTLRKVRVMFGETRHLKYSGERPYARAWEELNGHFTIIEGGLSLMARLETYDVFLQVILSVLGGPDSAYVDKEFILQCRHRISSLLRSQESIEDIISGLSFQDPQEWSPPPRMPMPWLDEFSFPRLQPMMPPMSPIWSDLSDDGIPPPAPDPPWIPFSPPAPDIPTTRWSSNSSATRVPISHWAMKVFEYVRSGTPLSNGYAGSQCFGREEPPDLFQRLATDSFIEVVRLPLDGAKFWVSLYWRPANHRARLVCTSKKDAGLVVSSCIPLSALKLTRCGSALALWRLEREPKDFKLWARLEFQFYEPLVLFYCTFTAMKDQDPYKCPKLLRDKYHSLENDKVNEKEEYSGEIKDDTMLHALRIYRDMDSKCFRLEARPRRGLHTETPIWTAFITKDMTKPDWIRIVSSKVLQLNELHPYVFCPNYSPPQGKKGKYQLHFTTARDAEKFLIMVHTLKKLARK
ncbi:uncharacterized protein PV09_01289 [Verruconis gallopava]|uniref:Uncharacterized protein n=1 Tax=Verruconis gallopava TaxID=253628 RepID=A0A0D2ANU5_9PEZI|nr:uncharacterized protein PV09_01289 [Verruconis gallopava]KIW08373.1 hypothetical protein PV09_01289 [Verruconis gallopava]